MRFTAWTWVMMAAGCGIQIGGSDELLCDEATPVPVSTERQPEHWASTVGERLTAVTGTFETWFTAGDEAAVATDTGAATWWVGETEMGTLTVSIDADTLALAGRSHPEPDEDLRCDDLVRASGRLTMDSALVTLDVPVQLRLSALTTEVAAELDPAAVSTGDPAPAFVTGTFDRAWVDLTAFHHHEAARSDDDVGWQGWLIWKAEDEAASEEPAGDISPLARFEAHSD